MSSEIVRKSMDGGTVKRALSMIEVALSTVIIAVVLLSAMNMVGAAGTSMSSMANRATGTLLAEQLMAEILEQAYEEPSLGPGSFGIEAVEAVTGDRSLYDDVDDYYKWSASPPQNKGGSLIADRSAWRRSVIVAYVNPADLTQTLETSSGVKRVTVMVSFNNVLITSMVALRADTRLAQ